MGDSGATGTMVSGQAVTAPSFRLPPPSPGPLPEPTPDPGPVPQPTTNPGPAPTPAPETGPEPPPLPVPSADVHFQGVIKDIAGTDVNVSGTLVRVTRRTEIVDEAGTPLLMTDLRASQTVEVFGFREVTGVAASRIVLLLAK